jgi:hypothetical protein
MSSSLNRVALVISAPPLNRFTLSHDGPAILDQGMTLYPNQPTLILSLFSVGSLVRETWRGISAGATQTVQVIEVIGPFV